MRVGVPDRAAGQQIAGLGQRCTDRISGPVDVHAREQRHPGVEGAVVADRLRHIQPVVAAKVEVILAMARGDVDEAGASLGGDEVSQQQWCVLVIAATAQRMRHDRAGEVRAFDHGQHRVAHDTGVLQHGRQQGFRDNQLFADPRQRFCSHSVHLDDRIVERGAGGDRSVSRHRPGRGGPDDDRGAVQRRARGLDNRKADPDRGAGMVVVLDLGFRQGGFFDRGPHHRPQAAIQRAVQQELADLGRDRRF